MVLLAKIIDGFNRDFFSMDPHPLWPSGRKELHSGFVFSRNSNSAGWLPRAKFHTRTPLSARALRWRSLNVVGLGSKE
jgi:hypothetical protein